jgi:putative membrane protein
LRFEEQEKEFDMKGSRAAFRTTFVLAAVAAVAVGCASPAPRRTVTPLPPPAPTVSIPAPSTGTTVVTPAPGTTVITPVPGGSVAMPLSSADAGSLLQLAQDSLAEMRFAQLAQQRSTNDQVLALAQRLMADHNRANAQLYPLAQQRGVMIPQTLDPMHQAAEQSLAALRGPQFDVAFLEQMIADHAKATAMLDRIAATAVDPSVRAWASSQLPVIRDHQAQTMGLHAQLARNPSGIAGGGVQPSASPVIIVPSR